MATVIGISIGADGTFVVLIRLVSSISWMKTPWEWKRHSTAKDVKEVAVGSAANIWCRNGSGELFRLQGSDWNGSWKKDTVASDVVTVSVGTDGTVWVGNKNGKLIKRSGADWRENPHASDAKEVAVGDAGHVWCRNGAGKVFKLQGSGWNGSWVEDTQASWVQSISAASDGTVWLASADPADKDRLFKREGPNNWKKDATGKAIQVSTSAADKVILRRRWWRNIQSEEWQLGELLWP